MITKIRPQMERISKTGCTPTIYIYPYGKRGMEANRILSEQYGYQDIVLVDNNLCRFNRSIISIDSAADRFKKGDILFLTSFLPGAIGELRLNKDKICQDDICVLYDRTDMIQNHNMRLIHLMDIADIIYRNGVGGSVAEAGVYKGNFAKYINVLFPDRKLYLFDSFEGFRNDDVSERDKKDQYDGWIETLKDTSVEMVLGKMSYRDNVIVKKGYIPQTFDSIEDTFAFVNLDVDLYIPILEGLRWFYPRMEKGGYIFVHDYFLWEGVEKAVREFCDESGVGFIPLADHCSVAIVKA